MIAFGLVSMTVAVSTPNATPDGEIIGPLRNIAWNSKRLVHGLAMLPVDVVKRAAKRAAAATKPDIEGIVRGTGHTVDIIGRIMIEGGKLMVDGGDRMQNYHLDRATTPTFAYNRMLNSATPRFPPRRISSPNTPNGTFKGAWPSSTRDHQHRNFV